MVRHPHGALNRPPSCDTGEKAHPNVAPRQRSAPSLQQTKSFGLSYFRESLRRCNISGKGAEIILAAWRPSTQRQYSVYLSKWVAFCGKRHCDTFQSSIPQIIEFLTGLYQDGFSYSAINSARSMLSSILITPRESGKEILIKRFLKGVFELRTPKPKYKTIWDVPIVLNYLKSLGSNDQLPLKVLTWKVVTLMALVSAQRCQTLHLLNIDFMDKTPETIVSYVNRKVKQTRLGSLGVKLSISKFRDDERLCVYSAVDTYLKTTEVLRTEKQLFVSHVKPHKAVSKETISKWIKKVLDASGLDTSIYQAHSTRAASTSAAFERNLPLDIILQTAGWANEQTFASFYKKEIMPMKCTTRFQDSILSSNTVK